MHTHMHIHGHGHGRAHEEQRAATNVRSDSGATQGMSPTGIAQNVRVLYGSQTGRAEEVRRFAAHAVGRAS